MREKIADDGVQGDVTLCGSCDDAHVRWGRLTVSLPREEFLRLADMLARAAAVFSREPAKQAVWNAARTLQ